MRAVLPVLALLAVTSPALAQYWDHYANARFGYEVDVPPGFEGQGESANGDGQVFYRLDAEQSLTVWGGHMLEGFEAEVSQRQEWASADNWSISYQASTPQWAAFSGQRDHRVLYQRMVTLCDGSGYAGFALEYNVRDLAPTDAVIEGLTRSLVASDC